MKYKMKSVSLTVIASALSLLVGCGSELEQAGINTQTNENIEPILYRGGYGFTRYSREVIDPETREVKLTYYWERADVDADFKTEINSAGIYGMSADAEVPVHIESVKDITGTVYDPRIKKNITAATEECENRNFNSKESNKINYDNWLLAKEDAETNNRPIPEQPAVIELEACENQDYIYELMSYTPVPLEDVIDVTSEGLFKYSLSDTLDVDKQELFGVNAPLTAQPGKLTLLTNITPTFDLNDEQWEKAFQATLVVGNQKDVFIINTGVRDAQLDVKTKILTPKRNLKPGRTFTMEPVTFNGFNTNAPVVLSKVTKINDTEIDPAAITDYDIYYSINSNKDADFVLYQEGNTELTIRKFEKLYIKVASKDGDAEQFYDKNLIIDIKVGEEGVEKSTDRVIVHTQPVDFLPAPELSTQYPVPSSATYTESVTLRGKVYISQDQLDFTNNGKVPDASIPEEHVVDGLTIYRVHSDETMTELAKLSASDLTLLVDESTAVFSEATQGELKRNVYSWEKKVDLNIGVNEFAMVATSNLTRTWPVEFNRDIQVAQSEITTAEITRIGEEPLFTFPVGLEQSVLENVVDLTLDPRDNSLYLLDGSGNNDAISGNQAPGILWRYDLKGLDKPTCLVLPWSWSDAGVNGVQFNHAIPEVGGVVIGGSPGNLAYYPDDLLTGDVSTSNKGLYQTNWEGVKHPGHFAYTASGQQLFMSAASNFNQDPRYQAIVGLKTPKIEDFVFKGFGAGVGVVAKETTSTQDAAGVNNNAVSLDIYSQVNRDNESAIEYEEWLLILDGKDNSTIANNGQTLLRKMKVAESYTPDTASSIVSIIDENNESIKLFKSDAIAISNKRGLAFVVDNKNKLIYELDLSQLATGVLTAKVIASPTHANQPPLGNVKAMVIEGDMDYMIISDIANEDGYSALLAMDLETYDMAYILKTNNQIVADSTKTHCDQ
ncbi:hypothetical protein [Catenovulum maritimum]|uniref:Lipoprotein n=1 Tax=Catenovulum maritimum TaxID=1513271 RepID=A0A0J8JLN4_9ALTE|nr:hypothetical protein [Catenovulum maritimum]KMT65476.1 hypothetical protein XM47_08990 [Catenovulum maritimum]